MGGKRKERRKKEMDAVRVTGRFPPICWGSNQSAFPVLIVRNSILSNGDHARPSHTATSTIGTWLYGVFYLAVSAVICGPS